jgi:diguanylate cyclase
MDEVLEREIALATASGEPLSFALGDLDHFKGLNDNFGHAVGDAVLKQFAGLIRNNIKGQDTPARFGGEEFAIIFPKTSVFGAGHATENIRKLLHDTEFILSRDRSSIGRVSVSFGVTQLLPGDSMADLIRRADGLLYKAKKLGRNRIETDM